MGDRRTVSRPFVLLAAIVGFVSSSCGDRGADVEDPCRSSGNLYLERGPALLAARPALDNERGRNLAWTGSEFGVVWSGDPGTVEFMIVDASGIPVTSPRTISTPGETGCASIVWSGTGFGVAWFNNLVDPDWCLDEGACLGYREVYFRALDHRGVPTTGEVMVSIGEDDSLHPDITWTGSEFGISYMGWRSGYDVLLARLTPSGDLLGEPSLVTPLGCYSVLLWTGNEFAIAWDGPGADPSEHGIWLSLVDRQGRTSGDPLLVAEHSAQRFSMAWTGSEYVLVWKDNDFDEREGHVILTRVDARASTRLDYVSLDPGVLRVGYAGVVWTGRTLGITWESPDTDQCTEGSPGDCPQYVFTTLASPTGDLLGHPLQVEYAAGTRTWPAMAWTGSEFGLSWVNIDPYFSGYERRLQFALVAPCEE